MAQWVGGVAIWLGVAFSLGWYYTFTYYGRVGWPMPSPEPCAAIIVYYFSVLNADTELQALHWMASFPAAALLWLGSLLATARFFKEDRPPAGKTFILLACAALPLVLPAPWMAYLAGHTADGFRWARMLAVALRRGGVTPAPWLTPLYFGLGVAALALQLGVYGVLFHKGTRKAWLHFPMSAAVLVVFAAAGGALLALPLRAAFE